MYLDLIELNIKNNSIKNMFAVSISIRNDERELFFFLSLTVDDKQWHIKNSLLKILSK